MSEKEIDELMDKYKPLIELFMALDDAGRDVCDVSREVLTDMMKDHYQDRKRKWEARNE